MKKSAAGHRFYTDLAPWWPLISPSSEYAEEAAEIASLLASASGPVTQVLELGSGGGHNAVHLRARFTMTLVDLSEHMLAVSRQLNPGCEHLVGDMRTVRLGRLFDAVLIHDAVDYMTDETSLREAIQTAYLHCRPGGVAVFVPDATAEIFTPGSDCGGSDAPDGRAARFLDWSWDPDPDDTEVRTEYVFLLRDAGGSVQIAQDTHYTGLFSRQTWLRLLTDAGFDAEQITETTSEDRPPRDIFLGRRPSQ